ncbi:MAG: NAD-dependent epimerase/dehydratase family protein [Dethiobacteria bacterium]
MITEKRIMLTGGAGFVGTKLCALLGERNEILIYDNLRRNSIRNTDLLQNRNITLKEGDVLDADRLKNVVGKFKPQIIVHLAAIAGIGSVIANPVKTMEVNMIGTYNILKAVQDDLDNLERFVDFSTSEVFGSYAYKVDELSTTNLAPVGEARWSYSVSKLAAEHLTYCFYKEYGLPCVLIRPFNVYGPGQVGEGAIHSFIQRAINDEEIQVHGDGDQIRSWCYIDDFVDGVMLCLEKKEAIGKTFNIGNPRGTVTINALAELIVLLSNSNSRIVYVPKGYADVEIRIPSIKTAQEILDFNPRVNLRDGIIRTIEWYRKLQSNEGGK